VRKRAKERERESERESERARDRAKEQTIKSDRQKIARIAQVSFLQYLLIRRQY